VDLTITGEGGDIRVELVGEVASLVGFEGPPSTEEERAALRITRENLKIGDALVRFSTRARCRLESAAVDVGGTAAGVPLARYRFACQAPERLDSAAFGLFAAFPVLQRAFVHYAVDGIRGDAELSRARPVASFVPLY
jgi:hypothetical protein